MFRKHDVELARSESAADRDAADAKYPTYSNEWFAEVQLLGLQRDGDLGLMDCYQSFPDSLFDFYPGFSWKGDEMREQVRLLLADPRSPAVAAKILAVYGFDMTAELSEALTDPETVAA